MHDEELLLDLLDSWQEAKAHGRNPTVAELCGKRTDLIEPLNQQIAAMQRIQKLGVPSTQAVQTDLKDLSTVDAKADLYPTGDFDPNSKPVEVDIVPPTVGETFAGFKLLGVLGEGGFGTVFRAEDKELRRKVALKVLHARALARPGAQESFLAEARALAAVQHDNVVPVFQVGREHGQPFLAMPLLGGETLASRLEREGALPTDEVRRIGREISAGLAAIHAKGLVHRDLKPGNIWLEAGSGRVKVLDLGLAHDPLATGDSIAGTPPYMSPEQAEGKELDFRSDLFSLGTVLYECASGRRPFSGDSISETLRSVREVTPPSATRANPGVPGEVSSLIERLHRKDPIERPSSANQVETLLRNYEAPVQPYTALPVPRSRRGLFVALAVSVVIVPLLSYLAWSASRPKQPIDSGPTPPPVVIDPLRVLALEVKHFAMLNDKDVAPRGTMGKESFGATLGDEFEVRARLSRPAFAYMIVFRPDGKDEVLYPQDAAEVPAKTDSPVYPSKKREDRYVMEEGSGLWLIAMVVSDESLPSYRDWRAAHQGNPWEPAKGKADLVWYDDGQLLDTLGKGREPNRGERASKSSNEKAPIVNVVDWLREQSKGTVSAVAFTVEAKR